MPLCPYALLPIVYPASRDVFGIAQRPRMRQGGRIDAKADAMQLRATLLLCLTLGSLTAGAKTYPPVTDERLENPEPANWLMYRRTYDSHAYSPLDEINTENVDRLKPVWTFSTGMREGHQAPPVVNDGRMFITTPHNHLIALDAATGEELWRYRRDLPEDLTQMHPTNRGVALYGNLVYMATADCYLVALDAVSGHVAWEAEVEDYGAGYYMTLAPLAAAGKVMVGVSGGEFGIRGFVAALDAKSGEPAWKTYTIPAPGEPGSESWPGDTWKTGGVPVWITGSYDPDTRLTYWGTGNGGPWMGDARTGDNLYATSVIAVDVDTGALTGHHQYHWNDSWDWDEVSAPLLIDFERDGRRIPGLVHPGRNGYLWFLARSETGIGFVDAKPYVEQDVITSLDPVTGRPTYDETKKPGIGKPATFCPSHWGGKDWATGGLLAAHAPTVRARERQRLRPPRGSRGGVPGGPHVHGCQDGDVHAGRGPGHRDHRRTAGLACRHLRGSLERGVREPQLGTRSRHRRRSRIHGRHQRSLLPCFRRPFRETPLAAAHELGNHRRAVVVCGERQTTHRGAVRLGGRRRTPTAIAAYARQNDSPRSPRWRALGIRIGRGGVMTDIEVFWQPG